MSDEKEKINRTQIKTVDHIRATFATVISSFFPLKFAELFCTFSITLTDCFILWRAYVRSGSQEPPVLKCLGIVGVRSSQVQCCCWSYHCDVVISNTCQISFILYSLVVPSCCVNMPSWLPFPCYTIEILMDAPIPTGEGSGRIFLIF